jgi:bifunctional aspartokinase / homoserine dehydrogenase 1
VSKTLIMKFGGTSIGTTGGLNQVLGIVMTERENRERLVLVASALDGVTDKLLEAARDASAGNQRSYRRTIATLRQRHFSLVEALHLGTTERTALQADIDRLLFELLDLLQALAQSPEAKPDLAIIDQTIGTGERLSARIMAALLRQNHVRSVAVDATSLIVTDDKFTNATPDLHQTRELVASHLLPMLERGIVPVVTGFIGSTPTGKPTTLGRGGSDLTASILGVCAEADEVWIWSAVDGIMTTDPFIMDNARVIPHLSYDEVAELAYFGARILHPRMVEPLREAAIPFRVKNIYSPRQEGTRVDGEVVPPPATNSIKAVTMIPGLSLSADHHGSMAELIQRVDKALQEAIHAPAEALIAAQSSNSSFICFPISTVAGSEAIFSARSAVETQLHQPGNPQWLVTSVSIITVIGAQIHRWPDVLKALDNFPLLGLVHGPSAASLSIIVATVDAEAVQEAIHQLILNTG